MDNRIKYIADYYGFTSQADMLIEESAEFIQAVSKFRRGFNDEYSHIKEELADIKETSIQKCENCGREFDISKPPYNGNIHYYCRNCWRYAANAEGFNR